MYPQLFALLDPDPHVSATFCSIGSVSTCIALFALLDPEPYVSSIFALLDPEQPYKNKDIPRYGRYLFTI